jgi:Gpi18-like mannosyltransferase
MPLWMYIVYALSYLVQPLGGAFFEPLPAITRAIVKSPSIVADVATAVLMFAWGRRRAPRAEAALIAALYSLSLPVWINSSWWGQTDALLMLPLVGALLLLDHGRGRWSWLCWAVAQATKPQAIVFLPVIAVATLRRYGSRAVVEGVALAAATIGLAAAPLVLAGQGSELWHATATSVGRFPRVSNGAFNTGFLLTGGERVVDTALWMGLLPYRSLGLLLLSSVALVICIGLLRRTDTLACMNAAAAMALAFFYLPTQIHERYLFLPLASLALCVLMSRTFLPVFLLLMASATLNIFGDLRGFFPAATAMIKASPLPEVLAAMNGLILVYLVARLYRDLPRTQRLQYGETVPRAD